MEKEVFFMVYLQGGNTPVYKHESLKSAEEEAKRLARNFKKKAYVLASIKSFELNEFKEEDCRPDSQDLPF